MRLREYMKRHGLRQVDVAQALGSYQANISELLSGKTPPKVETIQKIHAWTEGKVTANDLMPPPVPPARKKRRARLVLVAAAKRRRGRR